jgi:hypothetical protein
MPQLDNYLVTLGIKGQNLVLATMDKIRKSGKDLSKTKTAVDLVTKGGKGATTSSAAKKLVEDEKKENANVRRTHQQESDDEKKNNLKSKDVIGKFGQGVQNFVSAASTLDPTAVVSSVSSALGTTLSGISVLGVSLGRIPEGIAAVANSTLSMAKNSVDMAKQSTAAFYALTSRNAAASFYGGEVGGQDQLSRNERAMFIDAVSGSMGKIQAPLANEINKLIGEKDTRALARVGAGDWESTGTDKGWILGQIMSGVQGLPPSIKQKFQASLLSKNADLIQNMTPGQAETQRDAAYFADTEEKQTETLYGKTQKELPDIRGMVENMNSMQSALFGAGLSFASSINDTIVAIKSFGSEIDKLKATTQKWKDIASNPSFSKVRSLAESFIIPGK